MSKYSFGKMLDRAFEQALERVTRALGKEGFGIPRGIDGTLKKEVRDRHAGLTHPRRLRSAVRALRARGRAADRRPAGVQRRSPRAGQ